MNIKNNIISIYGSHDSSICINPSEGEYRVYEFERLLQKRYCKINDELEFEKHCETVLNEIKRDYNIDSFSKCLYGQLSKHHLDILGRVFRAKEFIEVPHHPSHAACALHQSSFDKALIISYDGGGFDGDDVVTFKIFIGDKLNNTLKIVANIPIDIANAYTLMAIPISEISKGDKWGEHYLSFAGKLMGLAAYGNVIPNWIIPMTNFFLTQKFDGNLRDFNDLCRTIGITFSPNTINGQTSYDLAATAQHVFSTITLTTILPYIHTYKLPICLTGGCGLNVLFNQLLKDTINIPIFVPPNPNDCGLSFGQLVLHSPPKNKVDLTYNGFGILDMDNLSEYIKSYDAKKVTITDIAQLISDGKIIGVVRGNSEVGPRALGNRSIICDPSYENMKDVLNGKVKFREWFRPFAPVVKVEEVSKYFEFKGDAKYMSFAPKVRKEWRNRLPSITHIDNTSRVQTVSNDDNKFLYDLIGELDKIKGVGVILNTSFNIKGKPILTKIEEAIHVLETTELDYVLIEDNLFKKR